MHQSMFLIVKLENQSCKFAKVINRNFSKLVKKTCISINLPKKENICRVKNGIGNTSFSSQLRNQLQSIYSWQAFPPSLMFADKARNERKLIGPHS